MDQMQWENSLTQLAKTDLWYQQLLKDCEEAEPEFLRIRASLPEEDQETLDRYITLCEELGHRMACLGQLIREEKKMDG